MSLAREHFGNHRYKLNDDQAAEIKVAWLSTRHLRDGHENKPTYQSLMNKYDVGRNCLFKLVHGDSYEWIDVRKDSNGVWRRFIDGR
jgi:hypothetical protein